MKHFLLLLFISALSVPAHGQPKNKGILLEDLTWVEAEKVLNEQTVVVLPLGAAAKEHGPHLKLKNDWLIAEYLKQRVLAEANVVIAPTINYNFYPAFLEYPGSTSLRLETARCQKLRLLICLMTISWRPLRLGVLAVTCSINSLLVEFPAGIQVIKIQNRIEHEEVAALRLTAPHRIV
jgi:creatinine amidohydrolase